MEKLLQRIDFNNELYNCGFTPRHYNDRCFSSQVIDSISGSTPRIVRDAQLLLLIHKWLLEAVLLTQQRCIFALLR